jgi:shikimate 5-dehydrogenase
MMHERRAGDRPSRIIVSNRSQHRIDEIRRIHQDMGTTVPVDYVLAPQPADNDAIVAALKPASVVINATGLGKDAPGSPLTDAVSFPERGIVWDLNYRGDLVFLDQARARQREKQLQIEDGWIYFIHGWTQVIAEVFDIDIPTSGPVFDEISRIALQVTKG